MKSTLNGRRFPIYMLIIVNIIISTDCVLDNTTCTLTGFPDSNPFPSLLKCYKYNSDSCCTSVHDDFISDFISSLLTGSCIRKYSELEDLACYGCNPAELFYTNKQLKKIKICQSFALRLWNATNLDDLNKPTTRFDNCGFKVSSSFPSFANLTDKPYLIPSRAFTSLNDFITKIGIPLFPDYTIELFNDTNIDDSYSICFGAATYIHSLSLMKFFLILFIIFI